VAGAYGAHGLRGQGRSDATCLPAGRGPPPRPRVAHGHVPRPSPWTGQRRRPTTLLRSAVHERSRTTTGGHHPSSSSPAPQTDRRSTRLARPQTDTRLQLALRGVDQTDGSRRDCLHLTERRQPRTQVAIAAPTRSKAIAVATDAPSYVTVSGCCELIWHPPRHFTARPRPMASRYPTSGLPTRQSAYGKRCTGQPTSAIW
jgi:hypothetical protein